MKKYLAILLMVCGCFAANVGLTQPTVSQGDNFFYYHNAGAVSTTTNCGYWQCSMMVLFVIPTGTDEAVTILIYLDPPEIGEAYSAVKIPLPPITFSALKGAQILVVPVKSFYQDWAIPMVGQVYLQVQDANSVTLPDLKIWGVSRK